MSEALRHDLTDLAEDVTIVDLRDRALGESRRRTMRQRAGVAAGVAMVLVLAGALTAVWPRPTASVLPVGPTRSVSTSPTPSPSASAEPTTPPPSDPAAGTLGAPRPAPVLSPWESSAGPSFPGTVVYVSYLPISADSAMVAVHQLTNGQMVSASIGGVAYSDCLYQSLTVSPDGRKLAVVLGDAGGVGGDELYVITLAGSVATLVARGVSCSGGAHPIWLPDSQSLRISKSASGDTGIVNVVTGVFTVQNGLTGYVVYAPGMAYRALPDGLNSFVVQTGAGQVVRRVNGIRDDTPGGAIVLGLSADGRYAAIGHRNTDPQIVRTAQRVIDTVTGADVAPAALLGQAGEVRNVAFVTGGLFVQGNQRWYMLSGPGNLTATIDPAPAEIRIGQFTYLP